jgi:plasmid stabilization system protein ParE
VEITFTRPAQRDLERIHAFIARDDPGRAYEVLADIRVAIDRLAVYPGLGRPGKKPRTRELIVPRLLYKVPYRVRGEKVLILRVLHTRQR